MTLGPEHRGDNQTPCLLWGIIGVAVAARVAAAFYLGNTVTPLPGIFDQISYHTLAGRVLDGHGFSFGTGWWPATPPNEPTAHWSYVYVLFLSGVYAIAGPNPLVARLIQAVACGVLQPLLTYGIACRLFGQKVGLVSAAVVALYAYFIYYAGALVTESLYIVAILWSIDIALRVAEAAAKAVKPVGFGLWLQLGLALAMAVLLRQVMLLVVPVIVGWAGWQVVRRRGPVRTAPRTRSRAAVGMAVTVLVIVLCIVPWTIRNYRAFHQFVPLNTNAGFALFWGNHPIHGVNFIPILPGDGSTYGSLIPDKFRGLSEAELDRALMRQGVTFISEEPGRFLMLSLSRVKEYVKFWPSEESGTLSNVSRVLSFGACLPFLLSGLVMATRRPWAQPDPAVLMGIWLLVGVALVYSLIHILTWTLVRYRLPVDGVLMPFVGLSMTRVHGYLRDSCGVFSPSSRSTGASA